MSFPRLVPEEAIDRIKAEEEEHQKHLEEIGYQPRFNEIEVQQALERKERFLELLAQCLSPKLACRQLGISIATYRRWRSTDSWFCEQLNHIILDWKEELVAASIGRAIGYVRIDEKTGDIETDAYGKVIRHGASDRLAITLLNADQKEQKLNTRVVLNVNFAALGIEDKSKPKQLPSNVVEGEFTERTPASEPEGDDAA